MRFDSHLNTVLEASVGLVNRLCPGQARGRPMESPTGADLQTAVAEVLTSPGGRRPRITVEDATAMTRVAATLREVFDHVEAGDVSAAARQVNAMLADSGARPRLDNDPADGWSVHFHGSDDSLAIGWTAGCATGMALAIGSEMAGRLGVCTADRCDRVYVDLSRNGAKRFCSTACQNRAKAAAFRVRNRGTG